MKKFLRQVRGAIRHALKPAPSAARAGDLGGEVAAYWTRHNVTSHHQFASAGDSKAYFTWRGDQYFDYMKLMPVEGQDGKVVLDYGCGPGHDLVGFGLYSKPARLVACDVSSSSIDQARARLQLHGIGCEFHLVDAATSRIPLADGSVDYIHCSGVLHHTVDPVSILREFRRVLRPDGRIRIMVYNYDSIWLHCYVAYQKMLVEQKFPGLGVREAFGKTTDGEDCPIARVYRRQEFVELGGQGGFRTEFLGAALSVWEASLLHLRFNAIMDSRLPAESREFLAALELDGRGLPLVGGHLAGVDGCFMLRPL